MAVIFKGRGRRIELEITRYEDPTWVHRYPESAYHLMNMHVSYFGNDGEFFDQTFKIYDDTMDYFAHAIETEVAEGRQGGNQLIICDEFSLWIRPVGERYELKADFNPYSSNWARRVITRTVTAEQLLDVAADLRACSAEAV